MPSYTAERADSYAAGLMAHQAGGAGWNVAHCPGLERRQIQPDPYSAGKPRPPRSHNSQRQWPNPQTHRLPGPPGSDIRVTRACRNRNGEFLW